MKRIEFNVQIAKNADLRNEILTIIFVFITNYIKTRLVLQLH